MTYIVMAKKPRGKWHDVSRHVTLAAAKKAAYELVSEYDVNIYDTNKRHPAKRTSSLEWERGDPVPKRSAPKKQARRRPAEKRTAKRKPARKKSIKRRIKSWL